MMLKKAAILGFVAVIAGSAAAILLAEGVEPRFQERSDREALPVEIEVDRIDIDAASDRTGGTPRGFGSTFAFYSQPPNQAYAYFSATNCVPYLGQCGTGQQAVADDFTLANAQTLEVVRFWGGYFAAVGADLYTINIHEDAGGFPGPVVYGETGVSTTRQTTGGSAFGFAEWVLEATLATPVALDGGQRYWIEIYNSNTGGPWGWESGNGPGNNAAVAPQAPGSSWGALSPANDLAFELLIGSCDAPQAGEDCNGNSVRDACELAAGQAQDCNGNGVLDECDLDVGGGSDDCNSNGVPDECEMGAPIAHNCCATGHGAGCNDAAIQSCVCAGDDYCCTGEWDTDCVAEVESFGCGTCAVANDCNQNGVLDECDIDSGLSTDCNANLVPDDCEIAEGTSADCNGNAIPDDCDLAAGTGYDCDGNGIPDSCEVSNVTGIRLSQESAAGAGDFDDNVLGFVRAYDTTLDAAGYFRYNLGNASSFNGTEPDLVNERSHLFLLNATDGLTLVVVHDRPNNSNGGSANTRYEVSGDPDGLVRTVEDDPGEGYTGAPGASVFTCTHAWATCCTDGVSYTGLDGVWTLYMQFTSSISGLNLWYYYAPGQPPIQLALQQGRRVRLDVVFDPSPADCNGNGVPDACDIFDLVSLDCNLNGIPDECELPPIGAGPDCNADSIPDDCQLVDNDCNTNGVPDECDITGGSEDCDADGVPDECEPDCNGNGVADDCDLSGGFSEDCDGGGVPDECEISGGTSADCNGNGTPDGCEPDCNGNGVPDDCDLTGGTATDCNVNDVPDTCDLAGGTSADCNTNGVPDECDLLGGSQDCNANGVPDECEPDCNDNGVADACDISGGFSDDCDTNGVPDECDLAAGDAFDCNGNGTLDSCEVAAGDGFDCNGNGVLDECDVSAGTATDCNANEVLDACELAGGTGADCNVNGVLDDCDIAGGTATDCNVNGVPDTCEFGVVWLGPSPYLGTADSPFDMSGLGETFFLEDFEDGALNVPGVSATAGATVTAPGGQTDSVDEDDGVIDGSGTNGRDLFFSTGSSGIRFTFNAGALGSLPTHAGVVWTDGAGTTTFEAFDASGASLGTIGPVSIADGGHNGGTAEDHFFGVIHRDGISAIHIRNASGGIEVDHLQFRIDGRVPDDCNGNDVLDECDIAGDTSEDCNANALPDECDIAAGTSADCNSNGVPDACEPIAPLIYIDFNAGVDSLGNDQGELVFDGGCGFQVVFTDDESTGGFGGNADGVHINNIGYGNIKAGSGDLVLGAYNAFEGGSNYHSSGIVARFNRGVQSVSLDDADDDSTTKILFAFDEAGNLIGQTSAGSQQTFTITTAMTGGEPIYAVEFDTQAGTAGGASDGTYFTIDNFRVQGAVDPPDRVLMVNINGTSYNADGFNIYQTLVIAGAEATYVNLSANGQVANLLANYTFEQIWVFDLSTGSDNYPADWQAIANWFNTNPSRVIICDSRMISSYWQGRWQNEGQLLTENYYENMRVRGGGLMLSTDHNAFQGGINTINSLIGLQPFVGNFSLTFIPIDVANPLMSTPNQLGPTLWDDSSPGQTPYGLQPNGRILYTIAWHSGNTDTPGISATIQGEVGFRVDIVSPPAGSTFTTGEPITLTASPSNGDPPFTYSWNSSIDGALGTGATLVVSDLTPGTHAITVLAEDGAGRDDDDSITVNILARTDLELTACTTPANVDAGQSMTIDWTVTNLGGAAAEGTWTDIVYLSDDAAVGGDTQLTSVVHGGPLGPSDAYQESAAVGIAGNLVGDRWIVVVTDTGDSVYEPGAEDNNASVCGMVTIRDTMAPNTSITAGPGDGAYINTGGVSFEWSGTDNGTATVNLTYASCLAPASVGCSPAAGSFGPATSATFGDLTDDTYVFRVVARDAEGNTDASPAQRTFTVDLTPPEIEIHSPSGEAHNLVCAVSLTFSEQVANLGTSDATLTGPAGAITINSVVNTGPRVYELRFDCQSDVGDYDFTVGPDVNDLAGNAMAAPYAGGFSIALADLVVTEVTAPAAAGTDEQISVSWTVTNQGAYNATGSWTDRVYLSSDQIVGGDTLLGGFTQNGPLPPTGTYSRTESVVIPSTALDTYWIIVVTDANNNVPETGPPQNNAGLSDSSLTVTDTSAPQTTITAGPANGSYVNTTGVSFTWTGQDNHTPAGALTYSYCLATATADCDPAAGPFTSDTTVAYADLTEADSPYTFKVAAADAEGNVEDPPRSRTFSIDLTPLQVVSHAPDGAVNDFVCAVSVTFNEPATGFGPADVTLSGPDGPITINSVAPGGSPEVFEFRFACQSQGGSYSFTIGTGIFDLAGNPLAAEYTGGFSIALPDLRPTALDIPTSGISGEQIEVTWTVTNEGSVPAVGAWRDAVYLSNNPSFGGDTLLGEFTFNAGPAGLAVGADYDRVQTVTLPALLEGDFWIIVVTDSRGDVPEGTEGAANRLISASPIALVLQHFPDMVVTDVSAPSSAFASRQVTLCWTVTNDGNGDTGALAWKDDVYLSLDQTIGSSDYHLGRFSNPSSLMPGESYLQCQTVTIPAGLLDCYYFLVRTDALNQVFEYRVGTGAESNNVASAGDCTDITLPPPADLQVTSVSAPATGFSGQDMTVIWEVTNLGDSPTQVSFWQDSIYVSLDETLDSGDRRICTVSHNGALPPGGSYNTSSACKLPRWIEGPYYVFVLTDSGNHVQEQGFEANNSDYDDVPVDVLLTPPPDLEVVEVSVHGVDTPDGLITVQWTVVNFGASPTEERVWYDAIWLSADSSFETAGDNVLLGRRKHTDPLASNGEYTTSQEVEEPGCLSGRVYFFVVADTDDHVEEYYPEFEGNNVSLSEAADFEAEEPDLAVMSVDAPTNGFSGQPITVGWTVSNINTNGIDTPPFADAVYLSADATFSAGTDYLLGVFPHEDPVVAGGSYTESRTVTVPVGLADGAYHLFVLTDADDEVVECADDNNVKSDSTPIAIGFTEPDLVVNSVTIPFQGASGQPLAVQWMVSNAGNRTTDATSWQDAVYLSRDATLSFSGSNADPRIGTFEHTGALGATQSYIQNGDAVIPPQSSGLYYIFVCTDSGGQVVEPGAENNNCQRSGSQVDVTATEPDLVVTAVTGPASGDSGDAVDVSWTVENAGERSTTESAWTDAVYLSADQTFDATDRLLGTFPHSGSLAPAGTYAGSGTVPLLAGYSGTFYVLVRTDVDENVYELDREANNVGVDPAGVSVSCSIDPDLTVTATSGPNSGDSGQAIQVSWTVSNSGARGTLSESWVDVVLLADSPVLEPANDWFLGEFSHNTPLAVGGSYNRTATVTLPNGIEGVHYLYVMTDYDDEVSECGNEGNNVTSAPVVVTIGLTQIDLQVVSVTAPAIGYAGQEIVLEWNVTNAGSSTAAVEWRDSVYLSQDLILDPETDPFLGFVTRVDPLGPGVDYDATGTFVVPVSTPPADYNVIVVADSGNAVFEFEAEDNNLGASSAAVGIAAPLPADLVVTDIVIPLTASPGLPATFQWTVTNQGTNAALGSWFDSIYLSEDAVWDFSDPLVAKVKHEGAVAAGGGTYTAAKTAVVPGVLPVPHYVIVRTDINNHIPEQGAGETNNTTVSTGTVDMLITELTLGVPQDAQLTGGGTAHFYQVQVAADETLRVTLDSASDLGANELYIRYAVVPDRGHFDDSHDNPFLADQRVTIPTTQAGTYYIMVYGDYVPNPPKAYTILAESLPFSITDVTPPTGSNTASVTVEILGARFLNQTAFSMIATNGQSLAPVATYPRNRSQAYATFDLRGSAPGLADVEADNLDGFMTVGEQMFTVLSGGGAQLSGRIIAPGAVRAGRDFTIQIEYGNGGTGDLSAPMLELRGSRTLMASVHPDGPFYPTPLRFSGVDFDGPAGVLAPGGFGLITVYIQGTSAGSLTQGLVQRTGADVISNADWATYEQRFRPADVSDLQWAAVWGRVRERVGDTWGEFEEAMARNATRLWQRGELVYDVNELLQYEIDLAWEMYPSTISGTIVDAETGDPLDGVLVIARSVALDADSNALVISQSTSDADGYFEHRVSAGEYELFAEGYYFDPSVSVTLNVDQDVRELLLEALVVPPEPEDPVIEIPDVHDATPALARDAAGDMHMTWSRGDEVWHAVFNGGGWDITGQVGMAEGNDPRITRGPSTLDMGSVIVTWQEGEGNEAELVYAVGRPDVAATNGFGWSSPVGLTNDVFADHFPSVMLSDSDEMLVVWLKKDAAIEDDTDLYYSYAPVGTLNWPREGGTWAELRTMPLNLLQPGFGGGMIPGDTYFEQGAYPLDPRAWCLTGKFGNKSMLRKLPVIGGPYGFSISWNFCGDLDCTLKISGSLSGSLELGRKQFGVGGSGSAKWKTNKEKCEYEFDSASLGFNASGGLKFAVDDIPIGRIIEVVGRLFAIMWEIGVQFNAQLGGELEWKAGNFPDWPDSGKITLELSGGPYGEVSLTDGIKANVDGSLTAKGEWELPGSPRLAGVCIVINASVKAGMLKWKWKYEYPENCGGGRSLLEEGLPPGAYYVRLSGGDREDEPLNELVITVEPLIGTGAVYPGLTVLPDLTTDLRNDGPTSLAKDAGGAMLAVWTKDSPDPNTQVGSSILAADFDGSAWSAPTALVGPADFNTTPEVVFDAFGTPMAVWSTASAAGVSLSSTAEEVLNAMDVSDIVYSRRIGGVWTAPAPVAQVAGSDADVALAADGSGQVLAAWIHANLNTAVVSVYASIWDGAAWSAPAQLSSIGPVMSVDCGYLADGTPMVVWSADPDGDQETTPDDVSIYHATYDGTWSAPAILPKPAAGRVEPRSLAQAGGGDRILPSPPDECCECKNDSECVDEDECTEDACVDGECKNEVPADVCDDDDECTEDTCDPMTGCSNEPVDCDDGDPCTDDTCDPMTGCEHEPVDCDDGDPCTDDSCDSGTGDCVNEPKDCDDGDECTTDSCDPATGECDNEAPDCDDGDACTEDTCDPATGMCSNDPLDCDDNDACTDDSCDSATGCINDPIDCDDGDDCTDDSCDPASGCVNENICNDDDECTIDNCDPGTLGCTYDPVDCDDNDPCTDDSCDPATGCINENICNDDDECTIDNCDPSTLGCSYDPVDCDDGDECTIDSCDPATGCINDPVDCDDGDECTVDSCDSATGNCMNDPLDCDDGDPCTIDSCDPASGCQNESIDCDDGSECTVDYCDMGSCHNDPLDCDDGSACTVDSCDPASGCQHQSVDCNDNNACTTDSCDPASGCQHDSIDCGQSDECTSRWCDPSSGCKSRSLNCCRDCPPVTRPTDPNEKIGPVSYGPEGWVAGDQTLLYTILFENIPEATAAAQVVTITDQLSDELDWRSFRVRNFGWGDVVVEVPEDRSFYQEDVPYVNTGGYIVRFVGSVNVQSGEAKWTLTTIDPTTGELPEDQTAGFLPPNDKEIHNGEGFVSFTIKARRNSTTGAAVTNSATIVFDVNEAIDTNEVLNTIDADAPSSAVGSLPSQQESPEINLTWSGQDAEGGSGLAGISIYVAVDDGDVEQFVSNTLETEAVYTAEPGHTYAFYSLATDNAGNVEEAPEQPDAAVTVFDTLSVEEILVNGGGASRSNLTDLKVAFTAGTNLQSLIDGGTVVQAASLWRRDAGGDVPVALTADRYQWDAASNTLTVDMTADGFGGGGTTVLADGNYELRLDTALITSALGSALPDTDGIPDGTYRFGDKQEHAFYRLAGDGNGDRVVNFLDLQLVRGSWLLGSGDPGFDPGADMNGDGLINFLDLQLVRSSWLVTLEF